MFINMMTEKREKKLDGLNGSIGEDDSITKNIPSKISDSGKRQKVKSMLNSATYITASSDTTVPNTETKSKKEKDSEIKI